MNDMKKVLILAIILLSFHWTGSSQPYWVCAVKGDVFAKMEDESIPLKTQMSIDESTILSLSNESRITLIDEGNKEMYTIKSRGIGTVRKLIKDTSTSIHDITSSYISFVKKRLRSPDQKDEDYMQTSGSIFRGEKKAVLGNPDKCLEALMTLCIAARDRAEHLDADGLMDAAREMEDLNLTRWRFSAKGAKQNFAGHLILEPLCLVDLSVNLNTERPLKDQLKDMAVPFDPEYFDDYPKGSVLCSYYVIPAGGTTELSLGTCQGDCKIVIVSEWSDDLSVKILSSSSKKRFSAQSENGVYSANFFLNKKSDVDIILRNAANEDTVVLFAVNQ